MRLTLPQPLVAGVGLRDVRLGEIPAALQARDPGLYLGHVAHDCAHVEAQHLQFEVLECHCGPVT
jgi:hypothetical protein